MPHAATNPTPHPNQRPRIPLHVHRPSFVQNPTHSRYRSPLGVKLPPPGVFGTRHGTKARMQPRDQCEVPAGARKHDEGPVNLPECGSAQCYRIPDDATCNVEVPHAHKHRTPKPHTAAVWSVSSLASSDWDVWEQKVKRIASVRWIRGLPYKGQQWELIFSNLGGKKGLSSFGPKFTQTNTEEERWAFVQFGLNHCLGRRVCMHGFDSLSCQRTWGRPTSLFRFAQPSADTIRWIGCGQQSCFRSHPGATPGNTFRCLHAPSATLPSGRWRAVH